jgi:hypothetical protein
MIVIYIFGLATLMSMALWMYCIVVQLENIGQQLCWMRKLQEKQDVRERD